MSELVPTDIKIITLNKAGATREKGAEVIAQAMSATKMTLDRYGEEHFEPDHTIRLRAEELRAKITGDIKPDGATTNTQINIGASSEEIKSLIEFVAKRNFDSYKKQTGEIIDVVKYK